MLGQWVGTHCGHGHARYFLIDMMTMRNHGILICFKNKTLHLARPSALQVVALVFKYF